MEMHVKTISANNSELSPDIVRKVRNELKQIEMENTDNLAYYQSEAMQYIGKANALNTQRAYKSDLAHFIAWCTHFGLEWLPASESTIVSYVSYLVSKKRKVVTIQRKLSVISQAHQSKSLTSPTYSFPVRMQMKGISRELGTRPVMKKPLLREHLKRIGSLLDESNNLIDVRDKAILLIGFTGAFRRSELAGLNLEDISFEEEGIVITLIGSKTDKAGEGQEKGIAYGSEPRLCPVLALSKWIRLAGIKNGPLFRSINKYGRVGTKHLHPYTIARIVKSRVKSINLDEAQYGGHSLRAGFATWAAKIGSTEDEIKHQTGHKSSAMVQRYIRRATVFEQNVTTRF